VISSRNDMHQHFPGNVESKKPSGASMMRTAFFSANKQTDPRAIRKVDRPYCKMQRHVFIQRGVVLSPIGCRISKKRIQTQAGGDEPSGSGFRFNKKTPHRMRRVGYFA